MADKMSTLILKVDLHCCSCYKKIRKILCKLQDQEGIRTISYDDGSNTIAVVGPFDPHRLSCKIRCKGGKVIKGIEIIQHGGSGGGEPPSNMTGPPPMKNGKKGKGKGKGKTKDKEMEPHPPPVHEQPPQPPPVENPPPPAQPAVPDSHISTGMPPTIEEKKPWEMAAELEPTYEPFPPPPPVEQERPTDQTQRLQPPPTRPFCPVDMKPTTAEIEIPSWPAPPQPIGTAGSSYGCSCCQPCYRGYYEGCRCCSCGRVYGYAVGVLPTPAGCYAGGGSYRTGCQLYSEEDPAGACAVM